MLFNWGPVVTDGQELSYTTTILSQPQEQGAMLRFTTSYSNIFGSIPITVTVPATTAVSYGDVVRISGKVKVRLLAKNYVANSISFAGIEAKPKGSRNVLAVADFLRQKIMKNYAQYLPQTASSLLSGIVLGVKQPFSQEFQKALQTTGLMHVIAASGMNVTLVASFLLGIFGKFLGRRMSIFTTSGALFFYCLLAGLQPSIVRATVMSLLSLSAQLFGRQYTGWYALVLTGGGMLLVSPELLFDVGFQLSFAATAGILFIRPIIPKVFFLSDDIATTIAAQLATIPILLLSFGQYGLLSILVNALVLWMVPILMVLGGVGALIGLLIPIIGALFIWLSYPLLLLFENMVLFFGKVPAVIQVADIPLTLVVGYYLLLTSGILFVQKQQQ